MSFYNRRITFDEVAELYDEVRLDYPEAMVEDVLALSGIPEAGAFWKLGVVRGMRPSRLPNGATA